MRRGELMWFSWTTYKSRSHRDRAVARVLKDDRFAPMMDQKALPFDPRHLVDGGFKVSVSL